MAEIAAGAVVAEQVVSTGLEVGAAVAVARPSQPLKASLSQIATSPAEDSSYGHPPYIRTLTHSKHQLTLIIVSP